MPSKAEVNSSELFKKCCLGLILTSSLPDKVAEYQRLHTVSRDSKKGVSATGTLTWEKCGGETCFARSKCIKLVSHYQTDLTVKISNLVADFGFDERDIIDDLIEHNARLQDRREKAAARKIARKDASVREQSVKMSMDDVDDFLMDA